MEVLGISSGKLNVGSLIESGSNLFSSGSNLMSSIGSLFTGVGINGATTAATTAGTGILSSLGSLLLLRDLGLQGQWYSRT